MEANGLQFPRSWPGERELHLVASGWSGAKGADPENRRIWRGREEGLSLHDHLHFAHTARAEASKPERQQAGRATLTLTTADKAIRQFWDDHLLLSGDRCDDQGCMYHYMSSQTDKWADGNPHSYE